MTTAEQENKYGEVRTVAEHLFNARTDWVTFYREVLGLHGALRRTCPTPEAMALFEQSAEYLDIQRMLTELRKLKGTAGEDSEPTRVITVRLPKSLHDALRVEAHEHCTSMNKLCISKLLQIIDGEMVPKET